MSKYHDRYNGEGYCDPTAYEAITSAMNHGKPYMPLVYIASPYGGNTEVNYEKAKEYCSYALSKGCIPLAPHLHYPQFMDDSCPTD